MINRYVSRVEQACGEGREFIAILKQGKRKEALEKILSKCRVKRSISGVMAICEYKGKEISVFNIGKLVLKGVKGEDEALSVLKELLT